MSAHKAALRHAPLHLPTTNAADMLGSIRAQIAALSNDLSGLTVVTGTGTGADGIVPTIAALAGAKHVFALTREYGLYPTAAEAASATLELARQADVLARIKICDRMTHRSWAEVDILVNCKPVQPISRSIIELLPPRAVVGLMAASWEVAPHTVDLDACAEAGIKAAGLKLDHPDMNLLPELGRLCALLVEEAEVFLHDAPVAILCNTPCGPFIERELKWRGALAEHFSHPALLREEDWRVIIIAMRPSLKPAMAIADLGRISKAAPNALIVQFSGTLDRSAAKYFGLNVLPKRKPERGQFGLPLEVLGREPMLRKLAGGLKAAELAYRNPDSSPGSLADIVNAESEQE